MPKKTIIAPLRGFVRTEISKAFTDSGFAKPREIARLVATTHPKDIRLAGQQLAEDALTNMARHELKNTTRQHGADTQMRLPFVPATLAGQLPAAISIPSEDASSEDRVVYKPLSRATLGEVESHLSLLATQINADQRRHQALKELRDLAVAAGAGKQSVLVDLLRQTENPPIGGNKRTGHQPPAYLPEVRKTSHSMEVR
jgi:hypothetical protein